MSCLELEDSRTTQGTLRGTLHREGEKSLNPFPDGVCGRGFFSPEDSSADATIRTAAHCLRKYVRSLVRCLLANPREARLGKVTRRSRLEKRRDETRRDETISISSRLVTLTRETVSKRNFGLGLKKSL